MPLAASAAPPPPEENTPLPGSEPCASTLALLARRRSLKLVFFSEPGPDAEQLATLLRLAARVPDHGKLGPWRFAIIEGEARNRLSANLADIIANDPGVDADRLDIERKRFLHAPVCVMVVSTAAPHPKIPEWEQVLSAGAVCFNLLVAAHAMGYAGLWITEWPAYDERARAVLGLKDGERIAGFIHLGTAARPAIERARVNFESRVSRL